MIGALYPTNAWDLPTYALLAVAAIVLRPARWVAPAHHPRRRACSVGAVVLFVPYYLHFKSLVGHQGDEPPYIQNLEATPVIGTIIRTFGVVTWPHTVAAAVPRLLRAAARRRRYGRPARVHRRGAAANR